MKAIISAIKVTISQNPSSPPNRRGTTTIRSNDEFLAFIIHSLSA
jgi:hypothetical protein